MHTQDAEICDKTPIRKALSREAAIRELKRESGKHFDSELTGRVIRILTEREC